MECTSKSIYIGNRWDAGAFSAGFYLQPFGRLDNATTMHHPCAVCFHCGAYINKYCPIEEKMVAWRCSLCGKENKLLSTSPSAFNDDSNFLETLEIIEDHPIDTSMTLTLADHAYICIIDSNVIAENDISSFLTSYLSSIPSSSRVGVIVIGRCINILQLCGCTFPMASDVLPASTPAGHVLKVYIDQGDYFTPADKALEALPLILQGLHALSDNKHCTTFTALASLLESVADIKGPGLRCMLVTSHTLSWDKPTSDNTEQLTAKLGRQLALRGCFIDVLVSGIRQIDYKLLDAFASATGGRVYTAMSLTEDTAIQITQKLLQHPKTSFCAKGRPATLEIRTSERGLVVDSVIGSLVSSTESEVPIMPFNESHVRAAMHASAHYEQVAASIISSSKDMTLCVLPRCQPDVALSVSYAIMANALRRCNDVVVQAIARFDDNSSSRTRVFTVRYNITSMISEFWQSVNQSCYISFLCRRIVAQVHDAPSKPFQSQVDAQVKDIIECLWSQQDKLPASMEYELLRDLEDMCRTLYHLREGPLLNGPATVMYLRQREIILIGRSRVSLIKKPISLTRPGASKNLCDTFREKNCYRCLNFTHTDVVVMIPSSVVVVDIGSHLIVRVDNSLNVSEEVTALLFDMAKKMQSKKTICPALHFTKNGQSAERMLFSRLAPAHNDTADVLRLYHPEYKTLKDASDVLEQFPITDQKSFAMYIAAISPKFMNTVRKYRSGSAVGGVLPEPPIERLPQQELLTGQVVSHGYRPTTGYDNL